MVKIDSLLSLELLFSSFSISSAIARHSNSGKENKREKAKSQASTLVNRRVFRCLGTLFGLIKQGKMQGKDDVEKCLQLHPILQSRSWKVVKHFFRNQIAGINKSIRQVSV